MTQLKELQSYATDGAPDIYIFTVSTLRVSMAMLMRESHTIILPFLFSQALELKYGVGSNKVKVATKLVENTIKKVSVGSGLSGFLVTLLAQVTEELVSLYNGKILVQALVLEWDFP